MSSTDRSAEIESAIAEAGRLIKVAQADGGWPAAMAAQAAAERADRLVEQREAILDAREARIDARMARIDTHLAELERRERELQQLDAEIEAAETMEEKRQIVRRAGAEGKLRPIVRRQ